MAYGVYAAARELGLDVPGTSRSWATTTTRCRALLTPPLSSYRWPVEEIVAAVVAATLDGIDDGRASARRVLHATATEGGSVGPPRS